MLFEGKNDVLSFLDILQCLFYTLCILEIYQFFFLSVVLKNRSHITYTFCEIKTTLFVGGEVSKGGFVNTYTPFCLFMSVKRQYLNFNDQRIEQYPSFSYPKDLLKYQFDAWQDAEFISLAGESLFSLG